MSGREALAPKQRGESFDSPPCRNSHAGTLLGLDKIKGRTMGPEEEFPLFFKNLRLGGRPRASTAVTPLARRKTKSVGAMRVAVR